MSLQEWGEEKITQKWEKKKKKEQCTVQHFWERKKVFFFGLRHTHGDKLGVSLGGVLSATTTKSWSIQGTSYCVIGFTGFQFFCGEIVFIHREWFLNLLWT